MHLTVARKNMDLNRTSLIDQVITILKPFYESISDILLDQRGLLKKYVQPNPYLEELDLPSSFYNPSVHIDTRCDLERLKNFDCTSYELSVRANEAAKIIFKNSVLESSELVNFPLSKLGGYMASKSNLYNSPNRCSQKSMADFGMTITDIKELEGKTSDEIINACLNWPEINFDEQFDIIFDDWSNLHYWSNSGGSHHMGLLCYHLMMTGKEIYQPSIITKYTLNLLAYENQSDIKIYAVSKGSGSAIKYTQEIINTTSLGIGYFRAWAYTSFVRDYDYVVIDLSKPDSDLSSILLNEIVLDNKAIEFNNFLAEWKKGGDS